MRTVLRAIAMSAAVVATGASAQGVNLTGPYRCVAGCAGPGLAFITQNGWELNLVNEVGQPSRGWVDYPAGFGSRGPISVRSIPRMARPFNSTTERSGGERRKAHLRRRVVAADNAGRQAVLSRPRTEAAGWAL
jgi:hypothetical protein